MIAQDPKPSGPPPDFTDRVRRLVKARADVLQTPRFDDRGRVVIPPMSESEAIDNAISFLDTYASNEEGAAKMRSFFEGPVDAPIPTGYVPDWSRPVKSQETELLENRLAAGREKHPGIAFARDVADVLSAPAVGVVQAATDLAVGAVNKLGANHDPVDIRAQAQQLFQALPGMRTAQDVMAKDLGVENEERLRVPVPGEGSDTQRTAETQRIIAAEDAGKGLPAGIAQDVGKSVGEFAGFGQIGKALWVGKFAGNVAKGAAGGVGKAASVAESVAHGAATFGAIKGIEAKDWGSVAKEAGWGTLEGAGLGLASNWAKAAYRGLLRSNVESLGSAERSAGKAIKEWGDKNGLFPLKGEAPEVFSRRVVNTWVDAGMPGGKPIPFQRMKALAVQGSIESLGMSAIDQEFHEALLDAASRGDSDTWARLGIKYGVNTLAGMALHMPLADIPMAQRRGQFEPTGERPQEPKPDQARTAGPDETIITPPPKDTAPRGGGLQAGMTELEGPREGAINQGTLKTIPEPMSGPPGLQVPAKRPPLAEFGWIPMEFSGEPTPGMEAPKPGSVMQLPGTRFDYTIEGGLAKPSQALRDALSLPETLPLAELTERIARASTISSLLSKELPGTEISVDGTHAYETTDGQPRMVRIALGELQTSPLGPEPAWRPAREGEVPARGQDHIESPQSDAVDAIGDVLNNRDDLPRDALAQLSLIQNVLNTVSAKNSPSVAEVMEVLPEVIPALAQTPPEQAAKIIRMLGEALTTKTPDRAIDDMARPQQPAGEIKTYRRADGSEVVEIKTGPKAYSVMSREAYEQKFGVKAPDPGPTAEAHSGIPIPPKAKELGAKLGEIIYEGIDATFVDQIQSLERATGDATLPERMKVIASQARTNMGGAFKEFDAVEKLVQKHREDLHKTVVIDGVEKPRWDALLHREIEPANPDEAKIADALSRGLTSLWNEAARSGNVLSKPNPNFNPKAPEGPGNREFTYFRATEKSQGKLPRVYTDEFGEAMQETGFRKRYWERLAKENPGLDAARLEQSYQEEIAPSESKSERRKASLEFIRDIEKVPYRHEGKQVLEPSLPEAFRRVVASEAGRTAVIKEVGQEGIPEWARKELGVDPTKKGVGQTLLEWFRGVQQPDGSFVGGLREQNRAFLDRARETFVRLQGGEPIKTPKILDRIQQIQGIRRAAKTSLSGIRDIPSIITEGLQLGGLRKTAKAVGDVLKGYESERSRAVALATLIPELGNANISEAQSTASRVADAIGEWGNIPILKYLSPRATERGRTVTMSRLADLKLEAWKRGEDKAGGADLAMDLGMTREQGEQLVAGTASEALQARFRHEFVEDAMSRGLSAKRSRAAANPWVRALVDFVGYSTKRPAKLVREIKNAARTFSDPKATLADKGVRLKQIAYRAGGYVFGGVVGDLFYYMLADLLSGRTDGFQHYVRDMYNYPGQMLGRAVLGQIASGPVALGMRALMGRPEDAADIVSPISAAMDMAQAIQGNGTPRDWYEAGYDLLAGTGMIPQANRMKRLAGILSGTFAAGPTQDPAAVMDDRSLVGEWRRMEGKAPHKRDADNPNIIDDSAYYTALGKIRDEVAMMDETLPADRAAEKVRAASEQILRDAFKLAPKDSVSAAVRSMQHIDGLAPADQQKLHDYVGNEERWERMMRHDKMVAELARDIEKLPAVNPTPFGERLETSAKLAASGARNAWSQLVDDTVEEEALARKTKQPGGQALHDLARRMSIHPKSLVDDSTFDEDTRARLGRMDSIDRRERFIYSHLRDRVNQRVARERKEERKEARKR